MEKIEEERQVGETRDGEGLGWGIGRDEDWASGKRDRGMSV